MGTVHYTDEALLQSGDLEDFGRFYDRYVKAVLAFFQRRVGDPEIAADLTAETFAAAMVSRGRYRARTTAAAARSGVDETTREPIVTFELTARGQTAFRSLTRDLAHRGSAAAAGVGDDIDAIRRGDWCARS